MRRIVVMGLLAGLTGCGAAHGVKGTVSVDASKYRRGQSVRVTVNVARGSVGSFLRIQRFAGGKWREVAAYNPRKECPVMEERPEGGYRFVTKRSPMCRLLQGDWVVVWSEMVRRQCVKAAPVAPGRYRVCVALFDKRCQAREGPWGFERPRGSSRFICSAPFVVR